MFSGKQSAQPTTKVSSQEKAAITDNAARKIIAAEATARNKKTEKLKALRLQQIAAEGDEAVPASPAKKKKK